MKMSAEAEKRKLADLRIVDLRNELAKRGLIKSGNKPFLVELLQKAMKEEGLDPKSHQFETYQTKRTIPSHTPSEPNRCNDISTNVPSTSRDVSNYEENVSSGDWNPLAVGIIKKIVNYVITHKSFSKLITGTEGSILNAFLNLPKDEYIFFCIKMYSRIREWYKVSKLTNMIHLPLSHCEVLDMCAFLSTKGFVDTDYSSEPIELLLELLLLPDINDLCAKFKLSMTKGLTKNIMIEKLILHCKSQSDLTFAKSTESILLDTIKEKMGHRVKINVDFYNALHKAHTLYKLTLNDFRKVNDLYFFVGNIINGSVNMPELIVNENFDLFSSISSFSNFQKAYDLYEEVLTAIENQSIPVIFQLCRAAYEELQIIVNSDVTDDRPNCIRRFTSGYQYTKALSTGLNHLTKHNPVEVNKWLQFLVQQRKFCNHLTGTWYCTLLKVQYIHLKQYRMAIQTLIKALKEKKLSIIDLIDLNGEANKIKFGNIYKVSQLEFDEISSLQPNYNLEEFPSIEIDENAIRNEGDSGKRSYYEKTENGPEICSVEMKALKYYLANGFTHGVYCEGNLIITLFFVLFWDIIYTNEIPYAFVSEIQYYPLDLMSNEFYTNRKERILLRLFDCVYRWSLHDLKGFIYDMWSQNSHKKSFINSELVNGPNKLYQIIVCIGRKKFGKIIKHLVIDFNSYRSGLPHLFLWNINNKKCKFIEVKGENYQLTTKEKHWLGFLRAIDVDIEVCYVHTMGTKRRSMGKTN